MKNRLFFIGSIRCLLILGLTAGIQDMSCAQGSGFGLGIIIGEPTGVSMKAWIGEGSAIDAAAAWSVEGRDYFQVHVDYLRHANVIEVNKGQLPFYYGIGGRLQFWENRPREEDDDLRFGIRIPVGITYLFEGAPLDVFAELVPVLDLIPSTDADLEGGIGVRYYF